MVSQKKKPLRVRRYKQPSVKELERRYGHKLTAADLKRREEIESLGLKVLELEPGRELTDEEVLSHLAYGLRSVVADAFDSDSAALNRLTQIHKLIYPERYKLNASVARALAVRRLMADLSRVVVPRNGDSFQDGVAHVNLTADEGWHMNTLYKLAARHWRHGVTLQSLAIRIYLAQLKRKGFDAIDRKILERDMSALRRFDSKQQGCDYIHLANGDAMPYYDYTEMWKQRKPRKPASGNVS